MNGRVPPHDIQAEMAVLGSMLLGDRSALERAMEALTRDDFYRDAHAHIFDAMQILNGRGEPVDIITLKSELQGKGILEQVGGLGYLMQLGDVEFTTANVSYYAKIVNDKALRRRLLEAASQIAALGYAEEESVGDTVDRAEKIVFEVARRRDTQGFAPLRTLLNDVFENVDTVYRDRGVVTGVDTGYSDLNYMTSGLQEGDLFILAARPSMGKCLREDSLIDDPATGERVTIREYVARQMPLVASVGACGQVRPTRISHWVDSGVKPCFRVTTRLGRQVEVTGHHPFLTVDGWLPLHDLAVGSKIAVPRTLPVFGSDDSLPLPLVRLMAYYIAEGGLTSTCPGFTNTDPEIIADWQQSVTAHFPGLVIRKRKITYTAVRSSRSEWLSTPNPLTLWLQELGLVGKKAEDKTFPECVWRWPAGHLAEFLKVLFSCDGTIYSLASYPRIEFAVASEGLARDVQHALTRFGIVAKFWRKSERCWRVEITEPDAVQRYQERIGWIGEKARRVFRVTEGMRRSNAGHLPKEIWKQVRIAAQQRGLTLAEMARRAGETVPAEGWNPHASRGLPRHRLAVYAAVLQDAHLQFLASPDLYWDEIISIEGTGENPVFDLTVPDGANFVANDVCVHNTSLAMGIAQNVCLLDKTKTVAVFSLEMSKPQLVQRMICSEARVDAHRVRTGYLHDDDWGRISDAVTRLWDANIFIDDSTEMSALEMRAKCRRLQSEHGLHLVVVDYLQLMRGSGKNETNRNEEITTIARGLKSLARELKVPVIALAQLSRAVERREDKRPMLSDLRDSGSIEAEADLVAFIYRPKYYERKEVITSSDTSGADGKRSGEASPGSYGSGDSGGDDLGEYGGGEEAEVIIAKHRNGPTGTVKLAFLPKYARFDNLAAHREDSPF